MLINKDLYDILISLNEYANGGNGSGNFGHAGRLGLIGGSTVSEEVKTIRIYEQNLQKQIKSLIDGTINKRQKINFGKPPKVLKDLGVPDYPMFMSQSKYKCSTTRDVVDGHIHYVPDKIMIKIPSLLAKPDIIFKSQHTEYQDKRYIVKVNKNDKKGNPIFVIIDYDNKKDQVNIIPTIYGRENFSNFLLANYHLIVYKK